MTRKQARQLAKLIGGQVDRPTVKGGEYGVTIAIVGRRMTIWHIDASHHANGEADWTRIDTTSPDAR